MSSKKGPQIIAAMSVAGGAFAAGTVLGWTNPAQADVMAGVLGPSADDEEFSWIGSSLTLGAAVICVPIGFVVNIIGRKITILAVLIPLFIGWILLLWGSHLWAMYIGRFLLGMTAGSFCVAVPLYTGEIAQKEIRGTLGSFFQLMITAGILFVYCVGAVASVLVTSLVCALFPLLFFVVFLFMPESPVFLIKKEKTERATAAMKYLRGADYDGTAELNEIKELDAQMRTESVSVWKAFKRRASLKALLIGLGLMFFQQLCGINAVIFYSTDIFKVAESGLSPKVSTIVVGVVQVIATLISTLIVDKVGRRILLLISGFVMALSTTAMGTYFFMKDRDEGSVDSLNWLPVVSLCLFIIMFSIGYGPVPWVMMGELFAPDIKGVAASIAVTLNWILAFVVTKTYSNVKDALGTGQTFWIFSVISLLGVVFVIFLVLETKGKSLNEIQAALGGSKET